MKAFRLINTEDHQSAFQEGTLPLMTQIQASYFFAQTHIDAYETRPHPAPRYQIVVTLKGKLKFTVSNGSFFILEPGILLIAKDLEGNGHRWELIEGDEWHRLYIVLPAGAEDQFVISNF